MLLVSVRGKVLYSISLRGPPQLCLLGSPPKGWPMRRPLRARLACAHRTSGTKLAPLRIHSTVREGKGELGARARARIRPTRHCPSTSSTQKSGARSSLARVRGVVPLADCEIICPLGRWLTMSGGIFFLVYCYLSCCNAFSLSLNLSCLCVYTFLRGVRFLCKSTTIFRRVVMF